MPDIEELLQDIPSDEYESVNDGAYMDCNGDYCEIKFLGGNEE